MKFVHNALEKEGVGRSTVIEASNEEEAYRIAKKRFKHHFGLFSWYRFQHNLTKMNVKK